MKDQFPELFSRTVAFFCTLPYDFGTRQCAGIAPQLALTNRKVPALRSTALRDFSLRFYCSSLSIGIGLRRTHRKETKKINPRLRSHAGVCYTKACQTLPLLLND